MASRTGRVASTKAEDGFGELLDTAQREPVMIGKEGRPVAVVLPIAEDERLEEAGDALWALRAGRAAGEGFATPEESAAFPAELRDAED